MLRRGRAGRKAGGGGADPGLSHLAEDRPCDVVGPSGAVSPMADGDFGSGAAQHIEGEFVQDGEVLRLVVGATAGVRSSSKPTSSDQWRLFSIRQWARRAPAIAGASSRAEERWKRRTVSVFPARVVAASIMPTWAGRAGGTRRRSVDRRELPADIMADGMAAALDAGIAVAEIDQHQPRLAGQCVEPHEADGIRALTAQGVAHLAAGDAEGAAMLAAEAGFVDVGPERVGDLVKPVGIDHWVSPLCGRDVRAPRQWIRAGKNAMCTKQLTF